MKAVIAFVTYHGNCERAAQTLATLVEADGNQATVVSIRDGRIPDESWDALVICAPVHAGSIVRIARRFALQRAHRDRRFALVVSHGAPLNHFFSPIRSADKTHRRLIRRGMTAVLPPTYLRVAEPKGPFEAGFEEKLVEVRDALFA